MTTSGVHRPPRVSIIVPAYNGAEYLGRALDSVMAQTVTDWELIISDDGSTDETSAIAARHANEDRRIRVVTATNGGVARARNRGFGASDPGSEFVIFLDQDDKWLPDTLEVMIVELETRADLVSVYGLARCIDSDDHLVPGDDLADRMRERFEYRGWDLTAVAPDEPTTFAALVHHNYPTTPGLQLVRRSVIDRVGPFDPDSVPGDDWDMSLRISRFGPIGFLNREVLEWRRHPEAQSLISSRWRQAYFHVRSKTLLAPENTPEQRRLARIGYLAPGRLGLSAAWSNVRGGRPREAARNSALALDLAAHYGAAVASERASKLLPRPSRQRGQ